MNLINDIEYKKIYMKRILSQMNNDKAIANHLKQPTKVSKIVAENDNNTKQDKLYKAQKFKRIQFQIGLNMKKDKSAEDIQMGIIPPIDDNRTTEQKVSDYLSQKSTAMKNVQLLFNDKDEALSFLDWLLADNQMIMFFNEQFVALKLKFSTFKNLLANRVKIYLERLYQKDLHTGGVDDPVQRSDFFGNTGFDSGTGNMYPTKPPLDDNLTGSIHSGDETYELLPDHSIYSDETQSQQSREELAADLAHFTENPELAQEHIDALPSQVEAGAAAGEDQNVYDENAGLMQYNQEILGMLQQAYEPLNQLFFSKQGNIRNLQKKRDFRGDLQFLMGVGLSLRACTPDDLNLFNIGDDSTRTVLTSQILVKINAIIKFVKSTYIKATPYFPTSPNPTDINQIGDMMEDINKAIVFCNILNDLQTEILSPSNANPFVMVTENANLLLASPDQGGEATYDPNAAGQPLDTLADQQPETAIAADNRQMQDVFDQHAAAVAQATAEPIGTYTEQPELSNKQAKAAAAAEKRIEDAKQNKQKEDWIQQAKAATVAEKRIEDAKQKEEWKALLARNRIVENSDIVEPAKKSPNKTKAGSEDKQEDIALNKQIKLDELKAFKEQRADHLIQEQRKLIEKYDIDKYRIEQRLIGYDYDSQTGKKAIARDTKNLAERTAKFEAKKIELVEDYNLETDLIRSQQFPGMEGHGLIKRRAPKKKAKAKGSKAKGKAKKYC